MKKRPKAYKLKIVLGKVIYRNGFGGQGKARKPKMASLRKYMSS